MSGSPTVELSFSLTQSLLKSTHFPPFVPKFSYAIPDPLFGINSKVLSLTASIEISSSAGGEPVIVTLVSSE